MTQDEIIEMWHKAWPDNGSFVRASAKDLEAFAKLVEDKVRQEIIEKNAPVIKKVNEHIKELQDAVKAEREACAIVSDRYADIFGTVDDDMAKAIASDIRARGEA